MKLYKIDWHKAFEKDLAEDTRLLEMMSQREFKQGETVSIRERRKQLQPQSNAD